MPAGRRPGRPRATGTGPVGTQVMAEAPPLADPTPLTAPLETLTENPSQAAAEGMIAAREGASEVEAFVAAAEAPKPALQRPEDILRQMNETRRQVEIQRTRRLTQELELRREHEEQVREAIRTKRPIPPVKSLFRSVGVDRSVPVDFDGSSAVPPGMHVRWVGMRDQSGQQSDNRVQEMMQSGYQFVKSKAKGHEGKPITNMGLVLMYCPPDAEAERVGALQRELAHSEEEEKTQILLLHEEARKQMRGQGGMFAPTTGDMANERSTYSVPVLEDAPELAGLNV